MLSLPDNIIFPETTILYLLCVKFKAICGAEYCPKKTSLRKDQGRTWQMGTVFPSPHSGCSSHLMKQWGCHPGDLKADLFRLKRPRTWEQGQMISLVLSPLWTGSLMMSVFKTILQGMPKGKFSELLWSALGQAVLRTCNPPLHCAASGHSLWVLSAQHLHLCLCQEHASDTRVISQGLGHNHMPDFPFFKWMPLKFILRS